MKKDWMMWLALGAGVVAGYWYVNNYGPDGAVHDASGVKVGVSYWDLWFGGAGAGAVGQVQGQSAPAHGTAPTTNAVTPNNTPTGFAAASNVTHSPIQSAGGGRGAYTPTDTTTDTRTNGGFASNNSHPLITNGDTTPRGVMSDAPGFMDTEPIFQERVSGGGEGMMGIVQTTEQRVGVGGVAGGVGGNGMGMSFGGAFRGKQRVN